MKEYSTLNLCVIKQLLIRAIENEKDYEREYGCDWGSRLKEYENILDTTNSKLGIGGN